MRRYEATGGGRGDSGVTLIELLISVAILGLIGGAITTAMFIGLRTVGSVRTGFETANNANFAGRFLLPDIQAWDANQPSGISYPGPYYASLAPPSCTDGQVVLAIPASGPLTTATMAGHTELFVYRLRSSGGECSLTREQETTIVTVAANGTHTTTTTKSGETTVATGLRDASPLQVELVELPAVERPKLTVLLAHDGTEASYWDTRIVGSSRVGKV